MERALPISRLYMADSEVRPEASRLYMAVACGKRSENVPPEVPVFVGDVPYISEKPHVKKPNLPYITQIRGCGRFLGDRTKGFGCVQSRGTQAGGGALSHDINDDRRSGRTPRLSDQAVPGTLAGEGSPLRWAYEEPHHPHGNQAEGDRTGIGRHAAETSRPAARRGRGRRGPLGQGVSRGGMAALPPGNRNTAQDGGAPQCRGDGTGGTR